MQEVQNTLIRDKYPDKIFKENGMVSIRFMNRNQFSREIKKIE